MPNKPLNETPPEATDPVTLVYFHNHFIQLNNWLNSLIWKYPEQADELKDVQKMLDAAQDLVKKVYDVQPEDKKRTGV